MNQRLATRTFPHRYRFGLAVARISVLTLLLGLIVVPSACGQWLKQGMSEIKRPLIDGEPFDLLQLNKNGEEALLKIKPLDKVPDLTKKTGELVFEFYTGFDEKLEVPLGSIEQITTYNELLITEANAWITEKEYSKAFRNLLYVYDRGGASDASLVSSLRKCMFLDAAKNFQSKDYELSLSMFEDIYQRDPNLTVPGFETPLIDIILQCYSGIIQKKFDNEEYLTVRKNVQAVAEKYPDASAKLTKFWQDAFLKRSDDLLAQSKQFAQQGKGREAHLAARQADQMVPEREEVLNQQERLLLQFPLIIVGVSQGKGNADPNQFEQWGSRRVGKLTRRRMLELTGLSDEGGKYMFLNGSLERMDDAGLKYTLELQPDEARFAVPPVNSFEVSLRLLQRGQPGSAIYHPAWAKIVDRVYVEDENHVTFTLRTPFIRPEALLQIPYLDDDPQNGPYILASSTENISTFELNSMYGPVPGRQHPVIIEQQYSDSSSAVDDLLKGNIDVVDRVSTADMNRIKSNQSLVVRSYVLPTVHFLLPKIRSEELKGNLHFRSGLSHTINREQIVKDVLCGGFPISGSEPISGPFPIGTDANDQIAYGVDLRVKPIPFNEKLGMVFMELALAPQPPKRPEPIPRPNLVIAHPNSSQARAGAAAIARAWEQAGIPSSLRPLKDGVSVPEDSEWDFLYMEMTLDEPLSDAGRMIGYNGFAKNVSAPIEQTLRLLNYAKSWQTACSALRRLHRQIRVDLSLIPLWQVTENYAYRNTIRNVGRDLTHLYENVDRWKIDLKAEEESDE